MCQVLHNSLSPNHPDLEWRMLSRFLEEIITLLLQSLSQTGIKREYNVLGKLSHVCLTGSFFLLSLSRIIHSGHCWKGRCFPLAPQPWRCSRLLTHSRRQDDSGNSNSTSQLCHSCIKPIKKVKEEAQEVIASFLCRRGLLGPAWRAQEPFCFAHQAPGRTRTGTRPPATVNCRINCPRGKFLPDPQVSALIQEDL